MGLDDMPLTRPTRRHFTEAARAAAIEARRRKREAALPRDTLEVFVVRRPTGGLEYGWEIRRFGALVFDKSLKDYSTADSDEAGRVFRFQAGQHSNMKPATVPI
ncbi:hypothetical protein [Lichenibacterium dinghuense]|uniref:hypothetical protein n=1 Tax=Lichenibacterium dinghuense TaxID=2895977 RepID=UPI001F1D6840|nr:hypothetical protein [Lichenibacterium sp. 6Y81]